MSQSHGTAGKSSSSKNWIQRRNRATGARSRTSSRIESFELTAAYVVRRHTADEAAEVSPFLALARDVAYRRVELAEALRLVAEQTP